MNPQGISRIAILDFGSQYTQVIARRIRELGVYSEILPFWTKKEEIERAAYRGLIFSGGPASVYSENAPKIDPEIYRLGIPILGICYGLQRMVWDLGGEVARAEAREYGAGKLQIVRPSPLFEGLGEQLEVWNSHGDRVERLPEGFAAIGKTENSEHAAIADETRRLYGLQFHPEVVHTPRGREVLSNFVFGVCGCKPDWTMGSFIERACREIQEQVGEKGRVLLGLSGGVDSSVAAALLQRAIGERLVSIFVDNGLLRAGERQSVREVFEGTFGMKLVVVDAAERFLTKLRGVKDPERKRKIIGHEFIRVFEKTARQLVREMGGRRGGFRFLAQGTLYPDVIESVPIGGNPAALIKSHHNVGGLPERMRFELVEPLRQLFKDEVRQVGKELGLPDEVLWRQPFPGPGLAVRIVGEVTRERLEILRAADAIVVGEMKSAGWYWRVWQSFAVLLPVRSVGVMGDERTYESTIALRIVESQDGMTADWVRVPYELLARISGRILNEVRGVNRVVYDISSKPPATIEWE